MPIDFKRKLEKIKEYGDSITYEEIASIYDDEKHRNLLIDELKDNYSTNIYYSKELYYIFDYLIENDKIKDFTYLEEFLESKLKKVKDKSENGIFILLEIYLKIGKNKKLIKRLFDEGQENDLIDVSNIDGFTEAFFKLEEYQYFIKAFLYTEKNWIRMNFYGKSISRKNIQKSVLNLNENYFKHFINELSEKNNIENFIKGLPYDDEENNFIFDIINKGKEYGLYEDLYKLLISEFLYVSSGHSRYERKIYSKFNLDFFNLLKDEGKIIYEDFLNDIKYFNKGHYYFLNFESFILRTFKIKEELENFLGAIKTKKQDYVIRNLYFYTKYNLKNITLEGFFIDILGNDKISEYEKERDKSIEESAKYDNKIRNQIKSDIKFNINLSTNKSQKYFIPIIFQDYLDKKELFIEVCIESKINYEDVLKEQIKRFLTFENLEITENILGEFKKTSTGYLGYNYMINDSFYLVFKVGNEIGFNFDKYVNRIIGYFPFQIGDETVNSLTDFLVAQLEIGDTFSKIVDIYYRFEDIQNYQPKNIIRLYNKIINSNIQIDNKETINNYSEILKNYTNLNNEWLDYESIYFQLSILGEQSFNYLKKLNEKKPNKNYFIDILGKGEYDLDFKKFDKLNKILIKNNQDKKSFLWRFNQINEGFVEIEFPIKGIKGGISGFDSEFEFNRDFIKVLSLYNNIDNEIEDKIIKLIRKTFSDEYSGESYYKYNGYVWFGISNYLKVNKSKIRPLFIEQVAELLKNFNNTDRRIVFLSNFKNIGEDLYSKLLVSIEIGKRKALEDRIDKYEKGKKFLEFEMKEDNILILTEGESDYYYFEKAFFELSKLGLINNNIKNFHKYLKKCKNANGLTYSNIQTDSACRYIATFNPEKIIIGIFDTDHLKDTKFSEIIKNKNIEQWKKGGWFETELSNYYIIFIKTPKHLRKYYQDGISTEILFGEKILRGKIITNRYRDKYLKNKERKICGKSIFETSKYYIDFLKHNSPVFDHSSCFKIYNKKTLQEDNAIHSFESKTVFGNNIKTLNISKTILLNFKHVFDYTSEIIDYTNKKVI